MNDSDSVHLKFHKVPHRYRAPSHGSDSESPASDGECVLVAGPNAGTARPGWLPGRGPVRVLQRPKPPEESASDAIRPPPMRPPGLAAALPADAAKETSAAVADRRPPEQDSGGGDSWSRVEGAPEQEGPGAQMPEGVDTGKQDAPPTFGKPLTNRAKGRWAKKKHPEEEQPFDQEAALPADLMSMLGPPPGLETSMGLSPWPSTGPLMYMGLPVDEVAHASPTPAEFPDVMYF